MSLRKIQWSAIPPEGPGRALLPFTPEEFKHEEHSFPSPYIVPSVQYVNTSTPPFSTVENPFICPGTDLIKLDHLHNPMMIFGQPFTGKTSLLMKLATQATAFYGPKHWIRMINLRKVALHCVATGKWPKDVLELIAIQLKLPVSAVRDLFKPLPNAKDLLRKKKFDKLIRGELFLDGFDEIPVPEREYFLKLLPQLQQNRKDCPIRVWISCRTYMKGKLISLVGDESSFEVLDYDIQSQKNLLFYRWKDRLFPKKVRKFEEDRLWEYTNVMYQEFCKEVKNFETTFGSSPLYLGVIASIFVNHAGNFMTLFKRVRQDILAGPNGDGPAAVAASTSKEPETPGNRKKKKKKAAAPAAAGAEGKKGGNANTNPTNPPGTWEGGDGVDAPTTQLMCQIAGMFTAEFLEYVVFTAIDVYCLKNFFKKEMTDAEYMLTLEREYRRITHLYAQYCIKTFPQYQYETHIPSEDNPSEMLPNLSIRVDEELHHVGFLVIDEKNHLVQLRNKMIGDFFLAKHFASTDNMKTRNPQFDNFYLRVLLFDGEAKHARSIYDNILHFAAGEYHPGILRDFLVRQYKLDDDEEWELIRNDGSVWHHAVMEGFHRTAMSMVNCFNSETERERIRKLLRIRVPLEIYEGGRNAPTVWRVDGGSHNQRHLVSALSLVAMFGYSMVLEHLLETIVKVLTPEEIKQEFSVVNSWTPLHYAAMHSNLWFFLHMYNDKYKIHPPPKIYNRNGQLAIHMAMSYSWYHIMILKDYFIPGYDTLGGCASSTCSKSFASNRAESGSEEEDEDTTAPCCRNHQPEEDKPEEGEHRHFREIICYRDMIKETHGPGNLLRFAHHECIRLMVVKGGEDINAVETFTGNTILHYAAIDGCLETVKFLLENGAVIEALNKEGKSPLHYAGMYGHRQIFMCLVKRGAKATRKDGEGVNPITLWTKYGEGLDKARKIPMSKEDAHFFKACTDIDKIMQEQTRARAAAKEAAKQCKIAAAGEEEGGSPSTDGAASVSQTSGGNVEGDGTPQNNSGEEVESEDGNNEKEKDGEDDEENDFTDYDDQEEAQ